MDNMFKVLKREHQDAFELMSELEDISGQKRRQVLTHLREELQRHMAVEEDSLYTALEGDKETREMVRELYNDHQVIKNQLKEMGNMFVDGEEFDEMLESLTENFDSHVREEETGLFSKAPSLIGRQKPGELKKRAKKAARKKAA
jgi:hemerythrin HHE cation binding domain-containing protein